MYTFREYLSGHIFFFSSNIKIQYDSNDSRKTMFSQRKPFNATLAAKLGGFWKSLTTFVTELGHLALGHRLSR